VTTACAAGAHSIADAYRFIRSGIADIMICGGTEASIDPISIAGFSRMRALTTKYNDEPQIASRPFDKDRSGFVMSEGAGCLVLESLEHARLRGAESKIYGEIIGSFMNSDGYHISNPLPDGNGAYRCMLGALKQSNLEPNDIDFINCHATSTPAGDLAEMRAIETLFGKKEDSNGKKVFVSSFKGSIGHLLGAAGSVETVFTVLGCKNGVVPASININQLDSQIEMINDETNVQIVVNNNQTISNDKRIVALKNSFGFGGTNVSICLSNYLF
jgi:3-oxoacyl-[acyl-carrier-protein] synthase II